MLRRRTDDVMVYLLLLVGAGLCLLPYVYGLFGSFKNQGELFGYPLSFWPKQAIITNYSSLLDGSQIPFPQQLLNSGIVTIAQTLLTLAVSACVGWGFAKYEFRGKRVLFTILVATLALPGQVTLVPLFLLVLKLGWVNTYLGVVMPGAFSAFGAFFMRQTMMGVPSELIDAARIDGAGELRAFVYIGLPLSRGALSVLALLTFLAAWNDFLWPLIVLRSSELFTYPIGLASLVGLYHVQYGMVLAGAVLATIPVLVVFVAGRRHLLDNLSIGAMKG